MEKIQFDAELKRFKTITNYGKKLIMEQEPPLDPKKAATPPAPGDPAAAGTPPLDPNAPAPSANPAAAGGAPQGLDSMPEAEEKPESTDENPELDDETEELDVTELVNMTKSIKKQLDTQQQDQGATEKINDVFTKLGELEHKLGEMDQVLAKIDQLGAQIQQVKPKTPIEKLEMRSLDSYPFNQKPDEFFSEKQAEMRQTGKNEYVLTKGEVENYGKNEIMKSFNPIRDSNF